MSVNSSSRDLLKRELPGRARQIDQLLGLMGKPRDYTPPSILISGNASLGKTTVVKALLTAVLGQGRAVIGDGVDPSTATSTVAAPKMRSSRYAFLNCVECHTPRLIFEHAIYQFRNRPQPLMPLSTRERRRRRRTSLPDPQQPQDQPSLELVVDSNNNSQGDTGHEHHGSESSSSNKRLRADNDDGDEQEDTNSMSSSSKPMTKKRAMEEKEEEEDKEEAAIQQALELRERGWDKCENVNEFVEWIRRICDSTEPADQEDKASDGQQTCTNNETRYLVLDHVDRLRETAPSLLPVLVRLQQLTGRNVCVIMISTIVWEKFRSGTGGFEPIVVHFPQYSKNDTLAILARDMPIGEDQELYTRFVDLVYDVFQRNCKDLNEIRHLVALLYPLYVKPVHDGKIQKHEGLKLHKHIQAYFVEAMDKLYLREISSTEWSDRALSFTAGGASGSGSSSSSFSAAATSHGSHLSANERAMLAAVDVQGHFNLPYYTKFLLFAAFLASYNPPRLDMRYFAKVSNQGGKMSRRAKKGQAKKFGDDHLGSKLRQQLVGPKTFPIERMLAVFYSILGDELAVEENVNVQVQIASLVSLRLLQRVTPMDKLDSIKCKCNVSYEMIKALAKSVSFEIDKYLFDFV